MISSTRFPLWMAGGALLIATPFLAAPALAQPTKALPATETALPAARQNGTIDTLVFGDGATETAHKLQAPRTAIVAGALGQRARVCLPLSPLDIYGGDLSFTMAVDPNRRNYFSVKLWGEDLDAGRLLLYVPVKGVDYQVGYRDDGDYLPLSVSSAKAALPGRFYYSTTLLPLALTHGKTSITLKIVSTGRLNPLGAGSEATGGNYQYNMKARSRGLYRAYTHTEPLLIPSGEVQGNVPVVTARPAPGAEVLAPGGVWIAGVNARINALLTLDASAKGFAPADVLYLAKSYSAPGFAGYHNPAVIQKVGAMLDALALDFALNPEGAVEAGGSEGWGGRFGALGTAINELKSQLQPTLNVPLSAATGTRTRRAAWAEMLFASREYGRTNRLAVTSQAITGDLRVYGANQGLAALGDARAFPEAAAQRYLREAIGLAPWLGNDTPNGGHELRFGSNYFMVTPKGLTREWGYAGTTYGEMASRALEMFELTGNPEFRAQAVKMQRARAPFRRPGIEMVGANRYRTMEGVGFLSWRGATEADGDGFSTEIAYADRAAGASALRVAAATLDPTLVGYARQMLTDGQFFNTLLADKRAFNDPQAFDVLADYQKIKSATSNTRLPMTSGQPDFAWADEELGVMALKHGVERLWIAPYWGSKPGTGINGVGRFHFSTPRYDQIGTLETVPQFRPRGIGVRLSNLIDKPDGFQWQPAKAPLQAYGGERLPIGRAPSNASDDAPFRGQVDFYAFRFGRYLIGMNRTQNRTFALKTPLGFTAAPDLFSGASENADVPVGPHSTVALFLDAPVDRAPIPIAPLAVVLNNAPGGAALEWNAASGAASYTIKRGPSLDGPFTSVKSGLTATTFTDAQAVSGAFYYTVVGVNANGESYESMKVASFAAPDAPEGLLPPGEMGSSSRIGGSGSGAGANGSGAANSDAPKGDEAMEMEPFVLQGNTEDGVPDPAPKPPSAPAS